MTKPRTERYLPFPNIHDFVQQVAATIHDQTTHGTLFNPFPAFPISCNKLHATIYDFVQQVARYDR